MKIIIERLQKVIELHEEIEKKNWDYVKEVCDEDEEEKGYFVYKTEYIAPKGIHYDIIQVTDAKNYYKIFVYQDDKYKRKGIELVRKLLEAEKERQAKWEAEYDYFYLITHPKHAIEMKRWWDYRMELMWRDILKGVKDSKRHDHDL